MAHHAHKPHPNEFTVLATFVVAGVLSLVIGAVVLLLMLRTQGTTLPGGGMEQAPPPPTPEEYRAEASGVLSPFLAQATKMSADDIADADPAVLNLVVKTQERLLVMTVPASERDAHLHFVLMLDQWRRALGGSNPDAAVVGERTAEVLAENPWLLVSEAAVAQ